jgi:hypothetical protein
MTRTDLRTKLEQHRAIMLAKKRQVTFALPPEIYDEFIILVADKNLTPHTVLCSLVTNYIESNSCQEKVKGKKVKWSSIF